MNEKKFKLLVVDDNEYVRDLICLTFAEETKIELVEADNGDKGWLQFQAHHPDIVLSDVMMPGSVDGLELCRRIKLSDNPCFVILFSAKGRQSDIELGMQAGADLYKVKPLSPLELIDIVNEVTR
jgi:DNA-binding response OmpR family regulator